MVLDICLDIFFRLSLPSLTMQNLWSLTCPGPQKWSGLTKTAHVRHHHHHHHHHPPHHCQYWVVWKLLIPKCESRNDLLHHHVPGWTNIVKCQHTLWQLKRFQFKGLSPNFHMATIQNIHKILEIAAQKVSTTMISLDIEFLEVLTKEIFKCLGIFCEYL